MADQELEDDTNEIEIKDLESLLQQHFDDEKLKIEKICSANLLPPGENFASIMLKLDAVVRHKNTLLETELHFVKKLGISEGSFLPSLTSLFEKEIFVYSELMNIYRDIEKKAGIEENNLIDILPKFFGYRNYLSSETTKDLGIYFLMENLEENGYSIMDRRIGIDVHHAQTALASLARYHALGVAMLQKRQTFTAKVMNYAQMSFQNVDYLETALKTVRLAFSKFPELQQFVPELETSMEYCKTLTPPNQPWATITHGDFWTNNILFCGDRVKFIDFQLYSYDSPLRDVLYFLCGSLDDDAMKNHAEALIETYRHNFSETLRRVGCDDSLYEDFEAELKRLALADFGRFALAMKFIVFKVRDEDKNNKEMYKIVLNDEISEVYRNRMFRLVDFYRARKWFLIFFTYLKYHYITKEFITIK